MKDILSMDSLNTSLAEAKEKLVVIDFHAVWCGPCKMIAPKMENFEKIYTDVVFLKVDVDEAEDVAAAYKISAMPTFKFIKGGEVVSEIMGANEKKVEEEIKARK